MTTYGDTLAGYLVSSSPGGVWALLILLLAVIGVVGVILVLLRAVKTGIDAV